ncbi:hypothetical protein QYF61_020460 [Mycteria americana]|uniref:Uncharacterized protein n=1 Tax=Mycteria americana TaxID=33587 RepID=A0AAN7MIH9_MYCAM|nr:hypothetical protein QYF61_020460 [Mycteria americana]
MQLGLRITSSRTTVQPGSDWPLFPCVVAAASLGLMGRMRPFSASQELLCPSEGLGLWLNGQSSAAPCGRQCHVASLDWATLLGCAGLGCCIGQGRWEELGRGWAGLDWKEPRRGKGRCRAKDLLQSVRVFLVLGSSKVDEAVQMPSCDGLTLASSQPDTRLSDNPNRTKAENKSESTWITIKENAPKKRGGESHRWIGIHSSGTFSDPSSLQGLCSPVFLLIYLVVLTGNSLIALTTVDSSLHSPMDFFLRSLSLLEICYASVTLPKKLVGFLMQDGRISWFCWAASNAFSWLPWPMTATNPYGSLHQPGGGVVGYHIPHVAVQVQVGQTDQVFTLPFCASHDLHHFFCDVPPLLELACADTSWNQVMLYTIILLFAILPFSLIVLSYIKSIRPVLKIPSVKGRHKAFSTCSSHLGVVTLFYGSATVVYLNRHSRHSVDTDKWI